MCLLHEVLQCDSDGITCRAISHTDPDHPLRENGSLSAVNGIEYAAQAMAVHGALAGDLDVAPGVLAAVRDVRLHVDRLDDLSGELLVHARKLWAESGWLLYEFTISSGGADVIQGRATVMLTGEV